MASSLGFDLCLFPAAVPPNGQLPNFTNPTSLADTTIAICVLMTVWALVFVIARVFVNRKKLTWSDLVDFMIVGIIADMAYTGVILSVSKFNRHQWDVPACWFDATYMKLIFANTFLIGPALYFSKSSIFLLYQQLFSVKKSMQIAVYIGLVATFLVYFPSVPLSIVYETPQNGDTWQKLLYSETPYKLIYWGIVQGSLAVALDIYIFILPLPTLLNLQMSLKLRLQLILVFATAIMGIIASVVALVYRVKLLHNPDSTWQQAAVGMAVVVENNVAIIVGSMPAVANFTRVYISESAIVKSLLSKVRGTHGDNSGKYNSGKDLPTFGSPNVKKPASYELSDPTATANQTIPGQRVFMQINHSAEYEQPHVRARSTDGLV